jgi:hypothetical protein
VDVGLGMIALGVSVAAVALMAWAAATLVAPLIGAAIVGLLGAIVFAGTLVLFAIALEGLAKSSAWGLIVTAMPDLVKGFGGLAIVMLAIAVTAVAAIVAGVAGIIAIIPLIGVAAFLVALGAVVLVLALFYLATKTVPSWSALAKIFIALAVVMGSMILMSKAAIIVGGLAWGASLGTLGVAAFAVALAELAVPAFAHMSTASKKVKWGDLAKTFLKLVGIFGAIAIIAPIAIFAGVTAGIAAVAMGGIALFAMAMAIPGGLIWSLGVMTGALKAAKLDWGELGKTFLQLVVIFGAVAILAVIAVTAGVIAAIGAIGLLPVAAFIWAVGKFLAPALTSFNKNMSGPLGKLGSMVTGLEALGLLFAVLVGVGAASLMLGAVFLNPMVAVVAAVGFAAILMLAEGLKKFLGPAVANIAALEMGDAGAFKEKMEAITPLMEMISGLGSMVTGLGDMGGDAEGAVKVMDSAAGFMDSMLGGLEGLIDKMTSTTLTDAQVESAMIIAGIMKPVGDLLKAMKPDPEMLKSLRKEGMFSSKFDPEALDATSKFMSCMMETMSDGIAKIMLSVKEVASTLTPAATKQLKAVLPLIADSIGLLGKMSKVMKEVGSIVPSKGDPSKRLEATLKFISGVMDAMLGTDGTGGHIQKVFSAVKTMAAGMKDRHIGEKIKIIGEAMGILGKFAKVIGDMKKIIPSAKTPTAALDLVFGSGGLIEKITDSLAGKGTAPGAMGRVLGAILEMAKGISLDAGITARIKIIADAFGVVGNFAGAIGEMAGFMPPAGSASTPGTFKKRVASAVLLINELSDVIGDQMGNVLNKIIAMVKGKGVSDVYKYRHSLKALPDAFKAMGAFTSALGEVKNIGGSDGGEAAEIARLSQVFVKSVPSIQSAITSMAEIGASVYKSSGNFHIKSMTNFGKFIDTTVGSIDKMPPNLGEKVAAIKNSFAELEAEMLSFGDGSREEIMAVIDIGKSLANGKKLTVVHENVNVNLSVKVEMSAEKLAEAIILADVGIATTGNKSAP